MQDGNITTRQKDLLYRSLARDYLIDFCEYTKHDWQTNWHHRYIADQLDKFIRGEIKKLIITCPPRVGKSEIATRRFPAYAFGLNPDLQVISASYSHDLASRMNRDVQRIIDSPQYKLVFPDTRLSSKNIKEASKYNALRNSEIFEIVGHSGSYRAAGVGSGITGMGADIAIIDDPIKDMAEAKSKRIRDNIWDWYTSALSTRLEKSGQVLVIMTRWHEDDLVGRILDSSPGWDLIKLEAIKETDQDFDPREIGEALWPDKFDVERYEETKRDLGSKVFESLYQQNPTPQEGTIVKDKWLNTFARTPIRPTEIVQSWDLSFKGNANSDFVVGSVWCKQGANYYCLDIVRGRWDFSETIKQFRLLNQKWPETTKRVVEDAANGAALYSTLKDQIEGITLWKPKTDKVSRLQSVIPLFEAGNVMFNETMPALDDAFAELTGFPFAQNDDIVDSITQALLNMKSAKAMFRSVGSRPKI